LWWAEGDMRDSMDFVLKDEDLRSAVRQDIQATVKKYNLDGIDIDFENKKAESKEAFSKFLTELSKDMHGMGKILVCTIEARTPIDSKYTKVTPEVLKSIQYANDFKVIGKVCDQVRIMAYDQGNDDKQLSNARVDVYKPVADIDWVEKVLTLAMRDIEWKKIIVGVPTYGYKYEITRNLSGAIKSYSRIGSMNWYYADELAKQLNIVPTRDKSGELYYTYKQNDKEFLVWYSDAEAIKQKINIAKLYKIGGIAIFKVDGNNDPSIWKNL
jgi:spore germination protein